VAILQGSDVVRHLVGGVAIGAPLVFISGLLNRLLLLVAFGWITLLGARRGCAREAISPGRGLRRF
jgi:hypothetical protein